MRFYSNKGLWAVMFLVMFTTAAFAQAVIKGSVLDSDNLPASNAEVFVVGKADKVFTDTDGNFSMEVKAGEGLLEIFDAVLGSQQIPFTVKSGEEKDLGTIVLEGQGVALESLVVVGRGVIDLDKDRSTPVAVSTIFKEEIQDKAQGNVEFPEVLENTPNVYVSNQAGGFGDSKMFTRGFDQTNTAFLLNGQPINGMEDGKMYWSNWAGMTDIANAVQIQRGLGSSKLAISSVGGTINIVTKTIDKKQGGYVQGIVGNDSYMKGSVGYNTGLSESGWAFSIALSHWQAHRKFARGTFGEGQNYFLSLGYKPNDTHSFNFLVTGAPQLHGHNFSKSIDRGSHNYNKYGTKWNPNYGFLDGKAFTWRQNYYHKPILNLNWDFNISDNSNLSTVLYASFGRGGGTGPLGDTRKPYGSNGSINYYQGGSDQYYNEVGDFLFDVLKQNNINNVANGEGSFRKGIVRRASVNNHNWYGLVSNFNQNISDELSFNIGFDGRMYNGDHFRQLTDLLGLKSYRDTYKRHESLGDNVVSATYSPTPWASLFDYANKNERVAYDYSEQINYIGGFGQLEYATDAFSTFFQGAVSTQTYQREGRWADLGKSEKLNKLGYNLKAGAAYNMNEENALYVNAGLYSRQPFLDNIFYDMRHSNVLQTDDVDNEDITGLEAGYKFETKGLQVNLNAYHTTWGNRFIYTSARKYKPVNSNQEYSVDILLSGVKQIHKGLELDFQAKPIRQFQINGYITYGHWLYDGVAKSRARDQDTNNLLEEVDLDLTGHKVGEAPQFSAGLGAKWDITRNLSWDANMNTYGKFYGFVNIPKLAEAVRQEKDYNQEKLKDYALVNTGLTYKFRFGSQKMKFRGNVRNLFNENYISQQDNYGYFFGNGRTWNASVTWEF